MSSRLRYPSVFLCGLLCALACGGRAHGAEPAPAVDPPDPQLQTRVYDVAGLVFPSKPGVPDDGHGFDRIATLLDTLRQIRRDPKAARKAVSIRIPPESPQEQAIVRALERPLKMEFIETPLTDVADFLRKELKVTVRLDARALDGVGTAVDTLVTFRCKRLPARTALEMFLGELDLTWVIRDDALRITTPAEAEKCEETRFYEVSDLVVPAGPPAGACPHGGPDFDPLIDGITGTVEPSSWDEAGLNDIRPFALPGSNLLVFPHTRKAHEEIGQLLTALRTVKRLGDPAGMAEVPVSLPVRPESAAEKAVRQALLKPVTLEFIECPLQDVIDWLEDDLKIEIHLDKKALDDVGIGTDTPITVNLKGISARSALRLVLGELDLVWQVRGDALLITTPEEAQCHLQTRVYPVGDLLGAGRPRRPGQSDFDDLVTVVLSSIPPTGWDDGYSGSIAPFRGSGVACLIASQTEDVHARFESLLAELRKLERKRSRRAAKPEPPTAEDAIRKALGKRVSLNFRETPLQDVIDVFKDTEPAGEGVVGSLKNRLGVEIQIDRKALDDVGVGTDARVTVAAKNISGRSALNLVLRPLGLTWVIRDEVVLITTPEQAESMLETKVYDVTDLVPLAGPRAKAVQVPKPAGKGATPDGRFAPLLRPLGLSPDGPGDASIFQGPDFNAVILTEPQAVLEEFEDLLRQLREVTRKTRSESNSELPP